MNRERSGGTLCSSWIGSTSFPSFPSFFPSFPPSFLRRSPRLRLFNEVLVYSRYVYQTNDPLGKIQSQVQHLRSLPTPSVYQRFWPGCTRTHSPQKEQHGHRTDYRSDRHSDTRSSGIEWDSRAPCKCGKGWCVVSLSCVGVRLIEVDRVEWHGRKYHRV